MQTWTVAFSEEMQIELCIVHSSVNALTSDLMKEERKVFDETIEGWAKVIALSNSSNDVLDIITGALGTFHIVRDCTGWARQKQQQVLEQKSSVQRDPQLQLHVISTESS